MPTGITFFGQHKSVLTMNKLMPIGSDISGTLSIYTTLPFYCTIFDINNLFPFMHFGARKGHLGETGLKNAYTGFILYIK